MNLLLVIHDSRIITSPQGRGVICEFTVLTLNLEHSPLILVLDGSNIDPSARILCYQTIMQINMSIHGI